MLFASRMKSQRYVMIPADRTMDASRKTVILRGKAAQFQNGRFMTDDPELIEWLLEHPAYGSGFAAVDDAEAWRKAHGKGTPEPQMQGASGTVPFKYSEPEAPQVTRPDQTVYKAPEDQTVFKYEVKDMVKQEVQAAMAEITKMLKESLKPAKPKRIFKCPTCGKEFDSGVKMGQHKVQEHGAAPTNS